MTMNKDTFYLPPDDPDLDRDYIIGRKGFRRVRKLPFVQSQVTLTPM